MIATSALPCKITGLSCGQSAESASKDVGLGKAVKTMRRGEKSLIEIEPQYGYGSKGNMLELLSHCLDVVIMPWLSVTHQLCGLNSKGRRIGESFL